MKKFGLFAVILLIFAACQESLEDRCARETKEYTRKNCPAKLNDFTTLDSLTFERTTHTLHYYYKLTGTADSASALAKFDAVSLMRNELKNSTAMKTYKDNHYRFAYTFNSEKDPQKVLLEVVFTDKDY